jgi:glucose/mannose transport system substrate-binding protein
VCSCKYLKIGKFLSVYENIIQPQRGIAYEKSDVMQVGIMLFPVVYTEVLYAANEELAIYHWWTAGGEKEAIDALLAILKEIYPEIELVENPVSGGGGSVMRGQIKTMVMAGQSPDTFQLTYGTGMLGSFVELLEPVDALFKDFPVPVVIKAMGTVNGHQLAIPPKEA